MKKKIIAIVFVVALVAAYGVYNNQNKNALADLMLDNVEALAQSEGVGNWYVHHYTLGNGTPAKNCWNGGSDAC